jgi:hypothetical protein
MRWSPDRACHQIADPALQDIVGRQPDRVSNLLSFENLVHLGIDEGGIAPEVEVLHTPPVADNHRFQHCTPAGSAVDVAWPQGAALDIAKLVEHEQRVIAGAAEMSL